MPGMAYTNSDQGLAANIKDLTDPQKEIQMLKLSFEGKIIDENGEEKQITEPLMNIRGIYSIIGQVRSVVNRVSNLTHLSTHEIGTITVDSFSDSVIQDLMVNWKYYGIDKDRRNVTRTVVLRSAERIVYATLKRSHEGGERKFWKGSQQDIRTTIVNDGSNKGIGKALNPMNWGK